ncbi:RimK family alpha-L-glutamate ligase [Gracilibacillus marinus]|jgi:gamma-F420-2:alpha-L-glutamate ligase|uniref:RimK family alpha-L-glutamate ligase n=1 Tax=Gracilibacillus marinus TaxID=630535 RepID=A0ABV8VWU1_9BACI
MYGWVIFNGHMQKEAFLQFPNQLKVTANTLGIEIKLVPNHYITQIVTSSNTSLKHKDNIALPSFVIFHDKDITLARQFEQISIPVFNSSTCIDICDNKVWMYQVLARHEINIPKTVFAPKVFHNTPTLDMESYLNLTKPFSYPFIVKEGYGSFGEQVYLIKNQKQYLDKVTEIYDKPFLLQQFIDSSYGEDLRLFVVGDHVVAAIKRQSKEDFRANVYLGSTVSAYTPTEKEKQLALQAAKAVGATYCGVDILLGPDQEPIICEVNTNAHVANILKYTGIDVTHSILNTIMKEIH